MELWDAFFQAIDASPLSYLACCGALAVASATHRITGQAFGLVCAPLIALAAPSHVPALILLCGLPVMVYSAQGDLAEIRWGEIGYAITGRVAGALIAATFIAVAASRDVIGVSVAVCVLIAVALSFTALEVPVNRATLTVAGFLSGAMATLTSVGAPPMGLLYQRKPFQHVRATLNAFFLVGAVASVASLVTYGLIRSSDVALSVALLPAIGVGVAGGSIALARLQLRSIRPLALLVSTVAALSLLARSLI